MDAIYRFQVSIRTRALLDLYTAKRQSIKMAILKQDNNQVEVRIKNTTSNTYYDEYVKTDRREEEESVNANDTLSESQMLPTQLR